MKKKGVSAIVYDDMGKFYFLILNRNSNWHGWEFPKASLEYDQELTREQELVLLKNIMFEKLGIKNYKIVSNFLEKRVFEDNGKEHNFSVYLVNASMNSPVSLNSEKHKTYLWSKEDNVFEKLTWDSEREVLEKALSFLKENSK